MCVWKKKSLTANLCRLVLSSTAYNIWRNWNETRHGSQPKTEDRADFEEYLLGGENQNFGELSKLEH